MEACSSTIYAHSAKLFMLVQFKMGRGGHHLFKPREILDHFRSMSGYIAFGCILFFAGIVVGGSNTAISDMMDQQLEAIAELAQQLDQSDNPTMSYILFIFFNNAIKSLFIMYLGAFLGLVPLFFLVFNGMIIGYLLNRTAELQGAGTVMEMIFKGLLPHGIIEIPAIIIAGAYGMRFGVLVLKLMKSTVSPNGQVDKSGLEILFFMKKTIPVAVVLTISLLVASLIESIITPWLLNM